MQFIVHIYFISIATLFLLSKFQGKIILKLLIFSIPIDKFDLTDRTELRNIQIFRKIEDLCNRH